MAYAQQGLRTRILRLETEIIVLPIGAILAHVAFRIAVARKGDLVLHRGPRPLTAGTIWPRLEA